jgi:hypothetical protein
MMPRMCIRPQPRGIHGDTSAPRAAPYGLCGYRCSTMQVRVRVTPSKT